jgi:hypothetical protein
MINWNIFICGVCGGVIIGMVVGVALVSISPPTRKEN